MPESDGVPKRQGAYHRAVVLPRSAFGHVPDFTIEKCPVRHFERSELLVEIVWHRDQSLFTRPERNAGCEQISPLNLYNSPPAIVLLLHEVVGEWQRLKH